MNKLILISTPDGNMEVVYVNNTKKYESEHISSNLWLQIVNEFSSLEAEEKELTWDASSHYYNIGFPDDFSKYNESDFT